MKDQSHADESDAAATKPPSPGNSSATQSKLGNGNVSGLARFVITWFVFIPLELPFMEGDVWNIFVGASGAAFSVAAISWLFTMKMKPTKAALVVMLCVAVVLYAILTAGRFVGRKPEIYSSDGSSSVQAAIPVSVRESLEKTARQINSQAPMRVEKHTVLNSASFSGRTAIYRNSLDVDLSNQDFLEFLRDVRPLTVANFERNPSDAKAFAKYGILVIYQYTEKGGKVMNLELDFAKDQDLAWSRQ